MVNVLFFGFGGSIVIVKYVNYIGTAQCITMTALIRQGGLIPPSALGDLPSEPLD